MNYFVHPQGLCESSDIGENTRIWAFAHVLPKARIGKECNICDHVFVENDVIVGDRVTVKCGVQLWDGVTVESDVFIGPNVTFTNDKFPRSKVYPEKFARTVIKEGASIGANATILPGIEIGAGAMIGAGSVVTKSVPPGAVVVGNPARVTGHKGGRGKESKTVNITELNVKGVKLFKFREYVDGRGSLTVGNFESEIPFLPRRYFVVSRVPKGEVRGEHAHKDCHQFLVCTSGNCKSVVDDGFAKQEVELASPSSGLYLPPGTWGTQHSYSADASLLVFASHPYDDADYIRNYDEFKRWKGQQL